VYALARRAIDLGLKDRKWTAAIEQQGDFRRLPPAVILDLDETVLDNSRYQGRMIREKKTYDADIWSSWVAAQNAAAVPGAVDFVRYADEKNVRVFFVTNRASDQEESTIANLARMALTATPDSILSSGENGWTSDKSPRRAFVAGKFRILALVGDDLNDFVSVANQSASDRLATAKQNGPRWGTQWFILPNAVYGGWDRSLYAGITDDAAILAKKRSLVTGF
jgi:acid phosphatase